MVTAGAAIGEICGIADWHGGVVHHEHREGSWSDARQVPHRIHDYIVDKEDVHQAFRTTHIEERLKKGGRKRQPLMSRYMHDQRGQDLHGAEPYVIVALVDFRPKATTLECVRVLRFADVSAAEIEVGVLENRGLRQQFQGDVVRSCKAGRIRSPRIRLCLASRSADNTRIEIDCCCHPLELKSYRD